MLYRDIAKILSSFFFGLALVMLIPLGVALYFDFLADQVKYPQPHSSLYFAETFATTLAFGALLYAFGKNASGKLFRKEGLVAVILIWILAPAVGALPFIYSGALENPNAAYFEMVSGLTTTGSSILEAKRYDDKGKEVPIRTEVTGPLNTEYVYYGTVTPVRDASGKILYQGVEALSMGLLFWRSFIQWLGGGGVMVLFIALLPAIGVGGKILFTAEVAGPIKDTLTPRIRETAINLWKIYIGLTVLQVVMLMATNHALPFFDALTLSFSTISTGGFSIRNASIGAYDNLNTEWVIMIFMILGAINFSLYYYLAKGKFYRLYDPELILFIILLFVTCALGSWYLVGKEEILLTGDPHKTFSVGEAIRYASFQIISTHTTTGYATSDYDLWPYAVQVIMLVVMFFGGMSGSTAAGMKIIRLIMLFRIAQFKIESLFRPDTVRNFKIAGKEVDANVSLMVLCFFLIMIALTALGVVVYVFTGIDPETALVLVASLINNVGLAFRAAGPVESCAFLSDFGLLLGSFLMILGRLEFFVVLAVLVPAFWKKV